MNRPAVRVWPALPKAVIRPEIYGHFTEHVGRCVHEGIWVGEKSRIPNEDGVRLDVLAALKHLHAPMLRWPGGCFAEDYHWRDGVGPRDERPATANIWWRQGEPNEFGTPEFMRLCRAVGCQPWVCANVGTGTAREAREWLEYCNFGGESALSAARGRDGSREPHEVRFWGVGGGDWGHAKGLSGEDYAREFVRYGHAMKALDPGIALVACGAPYGDGGDRPCGDWYGDFCGAMKEPGLLGHVALHRTFRRGPGSAFVDDDFRALFADVLTLERDLSRAEAALQYHYPDNHVGIVLDRWGTVHPEAQVDNGLEQAHTLRDALLAASVLNLLNRWSHRVTMASLAQTVNVLQCLAVTQGAKMFLTPTYYVFELMRPHMGGRLLTQEVESPAYGGHTAGVSVGSEVPLLDASASLSGRKAIVTVVNRSLDSDLETVVQLRESRIASVSAKVIVAPDPRAENSFAAPSAVAARRTKVETVDGDTLIHVFPRHSVTALSVTLE